ncbi:unnamed protein product [Durusdinium trenchii]|uniref:Uncharacterized protein n=1 Tax=Durusdinium trenchii TaxID=1381693 RepID=A0ABP0IJ84_9DINO
MYGVAILALCIVISTERRDNGTEAPAGAKSIGLVGGVMLLINNLAGEVSSWVFKLLMPATIEVIWIGLLLSEPAFPNPLPIATASQSSLIGTVLFNFVPAPVVQSQRKQNVQDVSDPAELWHRDSKAVEAFTSALPSWVNEKKPDVPVGTTFWTTMCFVVVLYSVVGIVGGMAYAPFYDTNENLFSKLNAGGSKVGQATVAAYPMLQNVTSIPVLAILIRCNLIQGGLPPAAATFIAVALPWLMSIPFYTGSGFDTIAEVGGLATSSVINFIIPLIM